MEAHPPLSARFAQATLSSPNDPSDDESLSAGPPDGGQPVQPTPAPRLPSAPSLPPAQAQRWAERGFNSASEDEYWVPAQPFQPRSLEAALDEERREALSFLAEPEDGLRERQLASPPRRYATDPKRYATDPNFNSLDSAKEDITFNDPWQRDATKDSQQMPPLKRPN